VKAGTIFDNILVTDDLAEAQKFAEITKATRDAEKKAHDKAEEERKATEEAAEDEDDHDHDHDHDEL